MIMGASYQKIYISAHKPRQMDIIYSLIQGCVVVTPHDIFNLNKGRSLLKSNVSDKCLKESKSRDKPMLVKAPLQDLANASFISTSPCAFPL